MTKPKPEALVLSTIRLEIKDGKLTLTMLKHPNAPVIVDAAKLERWCRKLYRDEVAA